MVQRLHGSGDIWVYPKVTFGDRWHPKAHQPESCSRASSSSTKILDSTTTCAATVEAMVSLCCRSSMTWIAFFPLPPQSLPSVSYISSFLHFQPLLPLPGLSYCHLNMSWYRVKNPTKQNLILILCISFLGRSKHKVCAVNNGNVLPHRRPEV